MQNEHAKILENFIATVIYQKNKNRKNASFVELKTNLRTLKNIQNNGNTTMEKQIGNTQQTSTVTGYGPMIRPHVTARSKSPYIPSRNAMSI